MKKTLVTYMTNEIVKKEIFLDENYVKDSVYKIRSKIIMLDFDLTKIYIVI